MPARSSPVTESCCLERPLEYSSGFDSLSGVSCLVPDHSQELPVPEVCLRRHVGWGLGLGSVAINGTRAKGVCKAGLVNQLRAGSSFGTELDISNLLGLVAVNRLCDGVGALTNRLPGTWNWARRPDPAACGLPGCSLPRPRYFLPRSAHQTNGQSGGLPRAGELLRCSLPHRILKVSTTKNRRLCFLQPRNPSPHCATARQTNQAAATTLARFLYPPPP